MFAELSAIQAATSSLKSAGDIAKALLDIKDAALVQAKVIELNRTILAAQSDAMTAQMAQLELLERKRELEAELAQLKDWETEKQRYQLVSADSSFVYALTQEEAVKLREPPHVICPRCYENRKKSILQPQERRSGGGYFCPTCDVVFKMWGIPEVSPESPPA